MTIEEAIKKAIEGGYVIFRELEDGVKHSLHRNDMFLDPLFWSSLGKAMGWEGRCPECLNKIQKNRKTCSTKYCQKGDDSDYQSVWLYHWHKFIDSLAEGKIVDEYFKNLN